MNVFDTFREEQTNKIPIERGSMLRTPPLSIGISGTLFSRKSLNVLG
jgi:hypothetical protein